MPQGLSSGTGGTEGWNCCLLLPLLLLLLLEASLLSSIQRCQNEDIYSCTVGSLSYLGGRLSFFAAILRLLGALLLTTLGDPRTVQYL